jgi:transcriptional regulator with XRE-family HTH domain
MTKSEICKTIRKEARITCRELAQVLGVSVGDIADIEHGRVEVSAEKAFAISTVCMSKIVFHYGVESEQADRVALFFDELDIMVQGERIKKWK